MTTKVTIANDGQQENVHVEVTARNVVNGVKSGGTIPTILKPGESTVQWVHGNQMLEIKEKIV